MSGNFQNVNAAALGRYPALLHTWLPGGRIEGREFVAGDITGAAGKSLKVNIDTGVWKDFASSDQGGNDPVSLYAAVHDVKPGKAMLGLSKELGVPLTGNGEAKPRATWTPILPVPITAPKPTFRHYSLGEPSDKWCYLDKDENLLFWVARFNAHNGKQVLPLTFCKGPDEREEWRWQAAPAPRPLYNLHFMTGSVTDVLLVEGERCAEAGEKLLGTDQQVSTTWPGGCCAVGLVDLAPLAGRRVTVWPDADAPGFKAALALCSRLKDELGIIAEVVLPHQDCPKGWDIADGQAEGWTRQQASEFIIRNRVTVEEFTAAAQARYGEAKQEPLVVKQSLRVVNLGELLSMDLTPREYVLHPVVQEQGTTMIYAPRGLGKTWAAASMAYAIASGQSVFGWTAAKPRRVLYLDGEMPATAMQERFASIAAGFELEADPDYLRILTPDLQTCYMPNIATDEGQAALEPFLDGVDVVFVDNIATLGRCGKENDAEGWLPVQSWLLRLRRAGKAVVLVHHAGKGGNQRGTSAREDILDCVIALRKPTDYEPEQGARFEIHLEKSRGFCGPEARPTEALLHLDDGRAIWTTRSIEDVRMVRVQELKALNMTEREIAEETGIAKSTVHRLLKKGGR